MTIQTQARVIHVYPVDDLAIHVMTEHCPCGPRVEHEYGGVVVIHNALDGREAAEYIEEITGGREQ